MISCSSILWAISFFGIGGWVLYYTGFKFIINHFGGLRFKKKILNPNLKELDMEIDSYAIAIKNLELGNFKPFLQNFCI